MVIAANGCEYGLMIIAGVDSATQSNPGIVIGVVKMRVNNPSNWLSYFPRDLVQGQQNDATVKKSLLFGFSVMCTIKW